MFGNDKEAGQKENSDGMDTNFQITHNHTQPHNTHTHILGDGLESSTEGTTNKTVLDGWMDGWMK